MIVTDWLPLCLSPLLSSNLLIEFKLSPNSPNNPVEIKENTNILVYCAGGYRSALAGKTLIELGFPKVFNIGGFDEWINSGGEIQPYL